MTEPRTEAGRTLLLAVTPQGYVPDSAIAIGIAEVVRHAIPRIEAEAATPPALNVERLTRAFLDEWAYWRSDPRPAIDGGTVRLNKFAEVQPSEQRAYDALLAILAASEPPSEPERLVQAAHAVMVMLDRHGPGIVPHLIDTDENAGQRLRDLLAEAGYPVRAARLTDTAPETAQQIFDQHGEPTDD